jgi:hypothetical protein
MHLGNLLIWLDFSLIILMKIETYSVYEAARVVGCSSQWIRVLLAEQRLDGAHKVDGQWQIPAAALEPLKQRREAVSA